MVTRAEGRQFGYAKAGSNPRLNPAYSRGLGFSNSLDALTLPVSESQTLACLATFITVFLGFPLAVTYRSERMLRVLENLGEEVSGFSHGTTYCVSDPEVPDVHRARGGRSRRFPTFGIISLTTDWCLR
jgi:hypothetical protein